MNIQKLFATRVVSNEIAHNEKLELLVLCKEEVMKELVKTPVLSNQRTECSVTS